MFGTGHMHQRCVQACEKKKEHMHFLYVLYIICVNNNNKKCRSLISFCFSSSPIPAVLSLFCFFFSSLQYIAENEKDTHFNF